MSEQTRIKTTLMRGGTSKAVFLDVAQLPSDEERRNRLLLSLFGSPDVRQIDGLGGADVLTSKCALMGPPTRPDADVDYTFAQIGIDEATVSYEIVCGNISSAAAVYAIEEGFVDVTGPVTTVRIHNTNTKRILRVHVQTPHGVPAVEGDFSIDGVPGTGAEVALDYSDTSGSSTGQLLPTGNVVDHIYVPSLARSVPVSIVDAGTVCVFFDAVHVGLKGNEQHKDIPHQAFAIAEELRLAAAHICKIPNGGLITPFQIMLGAAAPYEDLSGGRRIEADEIDFVARMIGRGGFMHKAFPGGGSICTAVAARIAGSVVSNTRHKASTGPTVRIGHPSGVITVNSHVDMGPGGWTVKEVLFSRTARRLMDGVAYLRNSTL